MVILLVFVIALNAAAITFCSSFSIRPFVGVCRPGTAIARAAVQKALKVDDLVGRSFPSDFSRGGQHMRTQRHDCPRCHGMMVEAYSDLASPDSTGNDMIGWRCINCGEYVDRLVLLNRWAQQGADPLQLQLVGRESSPRRSSSPSTRRRRAAA